MNSEKLLAQLGIGEARNERNDVGRVFVRAGYDRLWMSGESKRNPRMTYRPYCPFLLASLHRLIY